MKICIQDWNQVLADLIKELPKLKWERTDDILEADKIVLWNEVVPEFIDLIEYAHKYGVPVIAVQHGRRGSSRYFPPFSQQIVADKLCVWGTKDKKKLVDAGHPEDKIEIVGTTIFSHLKPREKHKGTNIVFCPEHWDVEVNENKRVAEELRKLKGIKITTKAIEGHNASIYDNPVFSSRNSDKHLEICSNVLSTADLVVGIYEGTFELMAQYLDIPVVIVKDWDPKSFGGDDRYEQKYYRPISWGAKKVTLSDLRGAIKHQLANPGELKHERLKIVREEGGIDVRDPLKKLVSIIKKTKRR